MLGKTSAYELVVIGVSTGAFETLRILLPVFPADYTLPIVVVQHLHPWQTENTLLSTYDKMCPLAVIEAQEKERIQGGAIYFAPANYHLLVEDDFTFALSIDARVHYVRPSIDVFLESAVDVYGAAVVGVILTGANQDGAAGMRRVKKRGGLTIVEDPQTAVVKTMPQATLEATQIDYILPIDQIGQLLCGL
ncbi:MAG: chemotaxis protein CheB [Anaerolineales bacterium]|nr:chemotaxis protein CheB [Anaerolineales bacterium]